jgi:hydrogenase maturation protease
MIKVFSGFWESRMKNFLLGLGNPSMGDDAVGLLLVERFFDAAPGGFEAVDMAHDGMRLLFYCLPETGRIIVVDCVEMGLEPGAFCIFRPEDVESTKQLAGISTHEGDVLKVIELGRQLGYPIPEILVFGVQPLSTKFGLELSQPLAARFEEYVAELAKMMSI